jgi:hypothetical protein
MLLPALCEDNGSHHASIRRNRATYRQARQDAENKKQAERRGLAGGTMRGRK